MDADGARSIVLLSPRLVLLRFRRPRFDVAPGLGRITWPIESGALVGPEGRGRGHLRLELRRAEEEGPTVLRAEVDGYGPRLADAGLGRLGAFVYARTQLALHESVMTSFLRSLVPTLTAAG